MILSLPARGHLKIDGTVVGDGDLPPVLTAADIVAGRLTYSPPLDGHGEGYASFTFQVNDGTEDSASYTMTINVANRTNTAPTARGAEVTATEDTDYTFVVGDFNYADADNDSLASVMILSLPGKGQLKVNGTALAEGDFVPSLTAADIGAGQLIYSPLADEHGDGYTSFSFQVNDGTDDSVSYTMTIDVSAVNDPAAGHPEITGMARVGETLTATSGNLQDPDGLPATFSYQWVRVDSSNNAVDIADATSETYLLLMADVGHTIKVEVSFTDDDGNAEGPIASEATLVVAGTNTDPEFPDATATRSVAENTAAGEDIGDAVDTTDADGDTLYYWFTDEGDDRHSFTIDPGSGQLMTRAPLDHETKASYTVTVGVRDGKDETGNTNGVEDDTITVTISVTNVDEAGAVALTNDAPPRVGTALVASLSDPDGSVSDLTWQWSSATVGGTFTEITGATQASYTPVTGDVDRFLKATARYTDGEGSGKTAEAISARATQAALVTNVAPGFTEGAAATREIQETLGSATTVTPADIGAVVAATDTDTGDTLTYTLEGTDASSFDIVSTSGQLRTRAGVAYDYETDPSYSVTVKVSDGTAEATIAVTINVSNEDEDGTVALTNNTPPRVGTALVASLSDPDGTPGNVTWQWSSAATAGGTFGDIASATSASYTPVTGDVGNFLKAKASYDDPQGPGKTADAVSASATEAGMGANAVPEFTEGPTATREIQETLGSATTTIEADIGAAFAATDTDTTDTLTYTLEGADASSFGIVSTSGQLRTKPGVGYDYETDTSYSVTVKVSDGTAEATIAVTINVSNEDEIGTVTLTNDNPPRVGTALVASLTDLDGSVSNVTWQWSSAATAGGTFTDIASATSASYTPVAGDVSNFLKAIASYDDPQGSGKTAEAVSASASASSVTISVTNVDEAGAVTLTNNAPPRVGTALVASLTDPDGSVSNLTWQWSSAATAGGTFTDIASATSASYTPAAGDVGNFLKATASYDDPQGSGKTAEAVSASATQAALVTNAAPEFTEGATATRTIQETLGSDTTATAADVGAAVAATDTDTSDTLTYTLEGADASSFGIVSTSGQLRTKAGVAYDYETDTSYSVTVKVSDGADSDTIAVTIDVSNEDEAGTVTLTNDAPPGVGAALVASLTDPDGSVSNVTWQWSSAATATGTFTDVASATSASYTPVTGDVGNFLKATASYDDPQGSGKTAEAVSASATQAVMGTNAAPEFTEGATATREIQETLGSDTTATAADVGAAVAATDTDTTDTLTYTLEGTDASSFGIVSTSGQLRTKAGVAYDYETDPSYSVTVKVSDGTAEATIAVTIDVSNEDEAGTVALTNNDPPRVDTALVASLSDEDGTIGSLTWQWTSAATATGTFTDITSATSASYTPVAEDVGNFLKATASYTDGEGSGKTADATSASATQAASVTNTAPTATSNRVTVKEGETHTFVASEFGFMDADGDTLESVKITVLPTVGTFELDGTAVRANDVILKSAIDAGQLEFTPAAHGRGTGYASFTFSVNDGTVDSASTYTMTIDVTAVNTGTIESSDPLPRALMARFGRTAAVHVLEHVEERLQTPREPGFRGRVAGGELRRGMERDIAVGFLRQLGASVGVYPGGAGLHGAGGSALAGSASLGMPGLAVGGPTSAGGSMAAGAPGAFAAGPRGGAAGAMAAGVGSAGGLGGGRGLLRMGLGGGDLLTGSDFAMNRETQRGGILSFWGRGAQSRFAGREDALSLGGDVRTTMFGAGYAKGPLVTGLSLSHSRGRGLGESAGVAGGQVASSVTGLYPWLGYKVTDRVTVWGVAGYGVGGLLLTPESGMALESGLSMAMAAAGARRELIAGGAGGFELAFKADALWVGTAIDGADGPAGRLAATEAAVTRFRTGLEGSRDYRLAGRLSLRPSVEVGLRHDGGDAETGAGMDVGGGLVVSDSSTGLSVDVRVRMLVVHQADGFRERGMAVSLSWDSTPSTPLGLVARVAPSWGGEAMSGAEALWGRETMAGMANGGVASGNRLDGEVGYGLPVGRRFVGTPRVGISTSEYGRDYRVGYGLGLLDRNRLNVELGVDAQRRESPLRGGADQAVVGRVSLGW